MNYTSRTIKTIKNEKLDSYSKEEIVEMIDKIIEDYEENETKRWIIDDHNTIKYSKDTDAITISILFNGHLNPDTVRYDGTKEDWEHLDKDNLLKEIPAINCKDGRLIQKL